MSDCCTPGTGFPNAATMQQLATNYPVVWEEICMIQQAILAASSQCQPGGGLMCTTIGGSTPMTFVTGLQSVTVVNGGSGYYIDRPMAYFKPPIGVVPTTPATATIVSNNNNILAINITDGGDSYEPVPATMTVTSLTGTNAVLEPLVDASGRIVNVNISNQGTGYTLNDTVTATRAVLPNIAYTDAIFKITTVGIAGEIVAVAVLEPGTGYQPSVTEVQIVSTLNPLLPYPLGGGFHGTVLTDGTGVITRVLIDNVGAGYSQYRPYLVITDPGTGATTSVALTGTSVSAIGVNTPGTGYTSSATGTVMNPSTAALPNPPATPAVVTLNASVNTYGTQPYDYWAVWSGAMTNKPIEMQLNSVLSYFKGLGYTINIQTNPQTGSTIQWYICW